MRSWRANSGAGIDGLVLGDEPIPRPGHGEVLVAVRAASLSYRELLVLKGQYVLPVKPDVVPISDGAGEVVALGPGVQQAKIGDRVTTGLFPSWVDGPFGPAHFAQRGGSLDGMLAEFVVLPENALVAIPDHLSYAEAATLPCAGVTAWHALSGVVAGDTVVTLGTGGVSLFAVQLCKLLGARVIATTSSPAKADRLRDLGADEVVNYRETPDWPQRVRELTSDLGADRIVDVAGDLSASLRAVAMSGQVAFVGFVAGTFPPLDPMTLFASGATVRAIAVGSKTHFDSLNRAISVSRMRPVLDQEFEFTDAVAAFRYYETAQPFGKVVITCGSSGN